MAAKKPKVVVTRKLPDPVETRMRELFDNRIEILRRFSAQGAQMEKRLRTTILGLENGQKLYRGEHAALLDPGFMARKESAEQLKRLEMNIDEIIEFALELKNKARRSYESRIEDSAPEWRRVGREEWQVYNRGVPYRQVTFRKETT